MDIHWVRKSVVSRKSSEKKFIKHRSLERDRNPQASDFNSASNYQRLKQLLWTTSSIINYYGVSCTVFAGCINHC